VKTSMASNYRGSACMSTFSLWEQKSGIDGG
jgi:hypothetical protein